jgi:O-antigen/teichoic acid export membrane protein
MVLLARWLGSQEFGVYAYVLVIVTLLALALSFGFNSSALRFVASYRAQRKFRRLSGYLAQSYTIVLILSSVGATIASGLLFALRDLIEPYYVEPLLLGLLCVPLWTVLNQLEATARAFGWMNIAYVPGYILRPVLVAGFTGGLLLLGRGAGAVSAVWALVGACACAAIVQAVVVYIGARRELDGVKPAFHTRHWFTMSLGFLAIDGFRMLLDNSDILLIGRFLDPDSVGVYFAVIRTSGLISFVSFSVVALAVPKFAEIHSSGTRQDLQKFVHNVLQLIFWPTLLAAVAMACIGPFLLSLFGPEFGAGYATMLVVLAGLVLRAATLPVEYLLNMTGHHRDTMRVYAVAALVNIALNVLLIRAFGIIGAALATYTAMLAGNLALYVLVWRRLGLDACVFPLMRLARSSPL